MIAKKTWVKSAFSDYTCEALEESELSLSSPATGAKRKRQDSSSRRRQEEEPNPRSIKKTSDAGGTAAIHSANWLESFAPTTLEELAVHNKKVAELQEWLRHCDAVRRQHPAQLLLLTGPSGCGKTATVRVLATTCGYQLQEYINPIDREVVTTLGDQAESSSYLVSQLDDFKSFLRRASRYKALLSQCQKRLILVEDFPNALLRDACAFEAILEDYMIYGKSPVIFIAADAKTRSLNIAYNLFAEPLKERFRITQISFNPIATTQMQRAMKRFNALMRQPAHADVYETPAQAIADSILISARGDIRNALINLHFASLKGAPDVLTKPMETAEDQTTKRKRKTGRQLKTVGRDESITMLHALGRVFNPKFTSEKHLLHSPEDIAEAFCTEPKKFVDFIHANYLMHFREIEHVLEAANELSVADLMLTEYREDALALSALNVAVRGVMVANATPIAGWLPVRGPKRWDNSQVKKRLAQFAQQGQSITTNLYATEYSTYVNCIGKEK